MSGRGLPEGPREEFFADLVWAERPGTGLSGDGTSNLLVLQQLDVEISLDRPGSTGTN
jgi:hypothetical protein